MSTPNPDWASRKVDPTNSRSSQVKSKRARAARRLAKQLEHTQSQRAANWAEGDQPVRSERLTRELDELHSDKRAMRRDIYRVAPTLEGQPVNRVPSKRVAR